MELAIEAAMEEDAKSSVSTWEAALKGLSDMVWLTDALATISAAKVGLKYDGRTMLDSLYRSKNKRTNGGFDVGLLEGVAKAREENKKA